MLSSPDAIPDHARHGSHMHSEIISVASFSSKLIKVIANTNWILHVFVCCRSLTYLSFHFPILLHVLSVTLHIKIMFDFHVHENSPIIKKKIWREREGEQQKEKETQVSWFAFSLGKNPKIKLPSPITMKIILQGKKKKNLR